MSEVKKRRGRPRKVKVAIAQDNATEFAVNVADNDLTFKNIVPGDPKLTNDPPTVQQAQEPEPAQAEKWVPTKYDTLKEFVKDRISAKAHGLEKLEQVARALDSGAELLREVEKVYNIEIAALQSVLDECEFLDGRRSKVYFHEGTFTFQAKP